MFKKIIFAFVVVIAFASLPFTACADEVTKDLFTVDTPYNVAVTIYFDKEMPSVAFISPSNTVIESSSIDYDSGDDWVQYYIKNAAAGTWRIKYDQKSNTEFEIYYSSYMDSIFIQDFRFDDVKNDMIKVYFTVDSDSDKDYQWEIYATVPEYDTVPGGILLGEGSATINKEYSCELDISKLSDFSNYYLRLDVYQSEGVEEVYDSVLSENTFTVKGHSDKDFGKFKVSGDYDYGDLRVDWSECDDYEEYFISVFDDSTSTTEPIYSSTIEGGNKVHEFLYEPSIKELRIVMIGRNDGMNVATSTQIISTETGTVVNPTHESTTTNKPNTATESNATSEPIDANEPNITSGPPVTRKPKDTVDTENGTELNVEIETGVSGKSTSTDKNNTILPIIIVLFAGVAGFVGFTIYKKKKSN